MRALSTASFERIWPSSVSRSRSAFQRDFRSLLSATNRDLALLFQPGVFAFFFDHQSPLFGFEVLCANCNNRILLNIVSLFLPCLNFLCQTSHALRVERVRRIEQAYIGLIHNSSVTPPQAPGHSPSEVGHERLGTPRIFAAVLVNFFHRHRRRHRAHRVAKRPCTISKTFRIKVFISERPRRGSPH